MISLCPSSVVCALSTFCFKRLLLQNGWMDFEIILQEGSLDDLAASLNKMATRVKNRKTFKRLLLLNQRMDFEIIIQECFLGDPLPKLFKQFRYVEINGRQGPAPGVLGSNHRNNKKIKIFFFRTTLLRF